MKHVNVVIFVIVEVGIKLTLKNCKIMLEVSNPNDITSDRPQILLLILNDFKRVNELQSP